MTSIIPACSTRVFWYVYPPRVVMVLLLLVMHSNICFGFQQFSHSFLHVGVHIFQSGTRVRDRKNPTDREGQGCIEHIARGDAIETSSRLH
uniref:Putative secreted peptide n=1 Tax=Anopheles braziliensis TaxID=58242 RepID=A0A2M3ZV76_9DIPT